ncbi:MAG: site-specific DNA-methyltransferase [Candidatus Sungbacteria bacterium]|nr:site-specific DNA-methyltransferase [Candidatus Sungbacteria bacterium]
MESLISTIEVQTKLRWDDNNWKHLPKRWGHSFHPMCSYLAMFPPGIPRYFIEQFTEPGDIVLDPFSGRGTAPLEACVSGRVGIGIDLSPLAYILTAAKVDPPSLNSALKRIDELRAGYKRPNVDDVPDDIKILFDGRLTLPQIVYLRNELSHGKRVDRFLLASLAGILHGGYNDAMNDSSYLSISMPNTFSMAPNYIRRYVRKNHLHKLPLDVFEKLTTKVQRLFKNGMPSTRGYAYRANARNFASLKNPAFKDSGVKLIITSPPYLKVVNYGTYNWIRLWLLGESIERTNKELLLDDKHGINNYENFLGDVLNQCERVLRPDGICALVIGDVEEQNKNAERKSYNLSEGIWNRLKQKTKLKFLTTIEDLLPEENKVTRIWGKTQGKATKTDRILLLYKDKLPRPSHPYSAQKIISKLISPNPHSH